MSIKITNTLLKNIKCIVSKTCINVSECNDEATAFEKSFKKFHFTFASNDTYGDAPGESM